MNILSIQLRGKKMTAERYTIEVNENVVYIYGYLTIREMFDHLNYFDREGYTCVCPGTENSSICLLRERVKFEEEIPEEKEKCIPEKNIFEAFYEEANSENKVLKETLTQVYSLLKFITDCKEEEKIHGMAETDQI